MARLGSERVRCPVGPNGTGNWEPAASSDSRPPFESRWRKAPAAQRRASSFHVKKNTGTDLRQFKNQMATIKGLANRKAFSLTDQQLDMIHHKFVNLFEQRKRNAPLAVYPESGNQIKAPVGSRRVAPTNSDVDEINYRMQYPSKVPR